MSEPEEPDPLDQERVRELMGDLADRVRGAGSVVDYMNLLLCLHFLRMTGGARWDGVVRRASTGTGSDGANALLHHIGSAVDEQLKGLAVLPGMREAVLRLEPRTYDDLKRVVKAVGLLGRGAFRLILCEYETRAGLRSGEFFTPRAVSTIMTGVARSGCEVGVPSSIYDPYARGGELLAEAAAYCAVQGTGPSALDVRGSSPGRDTWRLASMNLALQGVRPDLRLTRGAPWSSVDGRRATRFDFILTNPPFNMSDSAGEARGDGEWPYGAPPVGNDNFAYVQHVLTSLAEGGSAGVVMPNKAGNSTNAAEAEIRRNMVERGVVRCVVALPDRLFSSTPVPVSLWFLRHHARPCDEVLFVDARSLGTLQKGKRVLDNANVQAVVDACLGAGWAGRDRGVRSALVTRETLRARGYSLSATDHVLADQPDGAAADAAATEAWQEIEARGRELREADAVVTDAGLGPRSPRRPARGAAGRLPTGWAEVVLADVCAIKAGPSYSLLGTEQRTPDGDVPVVFPRHLRQGHIEDTGAERIPARLAGRLRDFRLVPGDIACIRSGAMGPPALVREGQAGWVMSPNLLRLRLHPGAPVDPRYLLDYLCRPDAVTWVRDRAAATAAPSISAHSLGNQPLVLPPLEEQLRIAEALAALEDQATAHRRFAEAVSDARAAMAERLMGGWSHDG
ncbi:N-6 DNA methylase [Streptomyces sp. NPDC060028]|uniref:type I restriction-modification system subunit M/S n=1 Tax=Streptomyces sp. NPDC060028 TaxID=3347041 RepID=UPI00369B27E6